MKKESLNKVGLEGYLKENTLAKIPTKTGGTAISGFLTIATGSGEDFRVRFYANEKTQAGTVSKNYQDLLTVLPSATSSIANIMKTNPDVTFDQAKQSASQIWVWGQLATYDRKDDKGNIISSASIEGKQAKIKVATEKNPFNPHCGFDIGAYVDAIRPEMDGEEETGRTIVSLSIPDYYREENIPLEFICGADIAQQIAHYSVNDSGRFVGELKNLRIEEKQTTKKVEFLDGSQVDEGKTKTTFVNERIIQKMTAPYEEDTVEHIVPETMRAMKVKREAKLSGLVYTPKANTGGGGNFLDSSTPAQTSVSKFQI